MTEQEILKLVFTNLPMLAIAIGVAKIYYKIASTFEKMSEQIAQNTHDIETLKGRHTKYHPEDAVIIYSRRKNDG